MWQAPGSVETLQRGNCADSPERELQEQAQGTACPSTDTALGVSKENTAA